MKDFYEFDEQHHAKHSNVWRYIAVALVFALLGGIITYYVVSSDKAGSIGSSFKENKNSNTQNESRASQANNTVKAPELGAKGDLYIKSDNPVVEIAEKVGPAVVGITKKSDVLVQDFFFDERVIEQEGYGSGIVVSKDGYIITNYHVIADAKELYVILQGGKKIKSKLIGGDKRSDVAVVKVDEPNLTVAPIGDSSKVKLGELAVAIGNPLGHDLAGTVTAGIISGVNRNLQIDNRTLNLIQTDAAISPGNSGGALVNSKGEVIGMNTVKITGQDSGAEGLGFAIPSNDFISIAKELIKKGRIERPGLEVEVGEINAEYAKELGYPRGLLVRRVVPDGPAGKAGIQPGDVIIGADGKDIKTIKELTDILAKHKVGDVIKVKLWRDGNEFVAPVKLSQLSQ